MSKVKAKEKEKEDWMQKKWRPMMAMMYMTVCVFDFIIFPIMFTVVQFWETQAANDAFRQWQPITLIGAGLFHMAMGAVLGITAWSRGQEKIAGVAAGGGFSNGLNTPQSMPTAFGSAQTGGFATNASYNYASTPQSFNYGNTGQPSYAASDYTRETISITPITGYKGKKAPIAPEDPII